MSAVFGPGDRVRCIKAWNGGNPLVFGRVYTVGNLRPELTGRAVCELCRATEVVGFDLMEFRPEPLAAWCPCAFAPTWDDDEVPQTVEEINELIGSAMK